MSAHPKAHTVCPRNRPDQSNTLQDQQISLIFEEVGEPAIIKANGEKFLFSN